MRPVIVAASVAAGVVLASGWLPGGTAPAAPLPMQKKQGDVVGAVWTFEARETARQDSKEIQRGRFRATLDGRLYDPKGHQIGTYAYSNKAQDLVKLNITAGKLKGSSDLVKVGLRPQQTWQGEWKMEDGRRAHLVIRMIKD